MKKTSTYGFTLFDLLVIISIIGILSFVLIPGLIGIRTRSYNIGAINCAKSIQTAQAIQLVDHETYFALGTGANKLNRSTDGINSACMQDKLYIADRSLQSSLASTYTFDVWEARGSRVYTVTPESLLPNQPGATDFSEIGVGGNQFP